MRSFSPEACRRACHSHQRRHFSLKCTRRLCGHHTRWYHARAPPSRALLFRSDRALRTRTIGYLMRQGSAPRADWQGEASGRYRCPARSRARGQSHPLWLHTGVAANGIDFRMCSTLGRACAKFLASAMRMPTIHGRYVEYIGQFAILGLAAGP